MSRQVSRDGDAAISFRRVDKHYGGFKALDGVSLEVAAGEFVSLLGPSGSGKSTLLGIAVGSLIADDGELFLHGRDARALRPHQRNIGMVFQQYSLFPHLTVAENIAYPLRLRKRPAQEICAKVDAFLDLMGLRREAGRYPGEISGGQAQRVAVARALVFGPDLMLMDEPLGALDKSLRAELQEEFRRVQRETGVPTLYVTHDQDEAMFLSDRIAVCHQGRIVADGSPRCLYQTPPDAWVAEFLGEANLIPAPRWHPLDAGRALAETSWGEVALPCQPGLPGARPGVVVLRPEQVRLFSQAPGAADAPWVARAARVESAVYLGARQRLWLILEDGSRLKVDAPGRAAAVIPGETLWAGWLPAEAWLVAAP